MENQIHQINDAGPIRLSYMVVMTESYLQYLEEKAISIAEENTVAPITYRRYVNDLHSRFNDADRAGQFLKILNSQDEKIQYTIETENNQKNLAFLDILKENNQTGTYDFKVCRRDVTKNVQIKLKSGIDPKTTKELFNGFLARVWHPCSNANNLNEELDILVNVFVANGHNKNILMKILIGA